MPFLFIGIPLLAVVVLNALYSKIDKRFTLWATTAVAAIQVVLSLVDGYRCLMTGGTIESAFFGVFTVDALSALVLFIVGLVAFVTIIVAEESLTKSRFTFGSAVLILMMGMNGVVMVRDIFSMYVYIEVTAAASFLLIAIDKRKDALEGAFKYYLLSALATAMMLLGIAMMFALSGYTSFVGIRDYLITVNWDYSLPLKGSLILIIAALLVKSGTVPFHTWVPDAHSSAPSPVSVVLAGAVIKVSGAYSLMRIYRDVFLCDPGLGKVMLILGLLSIIIGAIGAMGQKDIKRMLAFSSVSQVGYIVLGVATGSAVGFIGAALHFFNHATFKSLLFVDAAVIAEQTGTRDMDKMGGLGARMPVTSVTSVIGLLSMSGIPPLSGFWSKLLIVMAVWQVSPGLALMALSASVLTLSYFLILQKKVFFGELAPGMEHVKECGTSIKLAQVLLASLNVLVGVLFPLILIFFHGRGMI